LCRDYTKKPAFRATAFGMTRHISGTHDTFGANTTIAPASPLGFASVDILGEMQTFYEVDMHLLTTCRDCGTSWYESLPFLTHPMSRITKSFAKLTIRLQESMSITDIARNFGVDWRCVKDAEKGHLAQKYRDNSLKGVTAITIDEMYLFPHERKYVTCPLYSRSRARGHCRA